MRPSLLIAAILATALASHVRAASPQDYAWQWPVQTEGDGAAHVLELDAEVLQHVTRGDLRDLAAFNASGDPVPFAPWPAEAREDEEHDPLPWLRVPLPEPGQPDSLALRLERDADGNLLGLELRTAEGVPPPDAGHDLLVDRGHNPPAVSVLHVELAESAALPVNLRVRISASDDLVEWQRIGSGQPLLALDDNGLRIERLQLEFPATQARYLRLAIEGDGNWPALAALKGERRVDAGDGREWKRLELEGVSVGEEPGVYDYSSPGPIAVEQVDLTLADANSVAAAQVGARNPGEDWWRPVANFTVFRLGSGQDEVRHIPPRIDPRRDREWRLTTQPALKKPPKLLLAYRPERFVLLAQGPAPYTLAAGSVRAEREDYPVKAAIEASGKPPSPATLGMKMQAGGEQALMPKRGEDWQRWLLWAVLGAGAALVLAVSLRVLRHPKSA
ncbi:DUF3999 domain-containing protein [Arenimonas sp.]|uniref:DUF3999 domain-containing protein n=1 Tax=Arenimonas sp. TaxID=1872635 RepID=UPI0035B0C0DD